MLLLYCTTNTPEIEIKHTCYVYIVRGNTKYVLHMYNVITSLLINAIEIVLEALKKRNQLKKNLISKM